MASGVKVAESVKNLFNQMKVVKNDADHCERIRLVVFDIVGKEIVETKIWKEKDLGCDDAFTLFKSLLKQKECHYILYDCHYETKESSKKQELIFATWCCESASIKVKMNYASSKDALLKVLDGLKHTWQFNDMSDCGDKDCFAAKLGDVLKLEGCCVHT